VLHSGVKIFLWPRWVYLFHLFCSVLLLSVFAIISILFLQLYPYETLKCKENDSRLYKAICSWGRCSTHLYGGIYLHYCCLSHLIASICNTRMHYWTSIWLTTPSVPKNCKIMVDQRSLLWWDIFLLEIKCNLFFSSGIKWWWFFRGVLFDWLSWSGCYLLGMPPYFWGAEIPSMVFPFVLTEGYSIYSVGFGRRHCPNAHLDSVFSVRAFNTRQGCSSEDQEWRKTFRDRRWQTTLSRVFVNSHIHWQLIGSQFCDNTCSMGVSPAFSPSEFSS
jgi:hypothetical protein